MVSEKDQGNYEAELYRLKGEFRLAQGADLVEVEEFFQRAIEIARRRNAKSQELRAAISLGRLWRSQGSQGKMAEARSIVAEICGWFTEGFDTPDLKAARALLDELEEGTRPADSRAGVEVGVASG